MTIDDILQKEQPEVGDMCRVIEHYIKVRKHVEITCSPGFHEVFMLTYAYRHAKKWLLANRK